MCGASRVVVARANGESGIDPAHGGLKNGHEHRICPISSVRDDENGVTRRRRAVVGTAQSERPFSWNARVAMKKANVLARVRERGMASRRHYEPRRGEENQLVRN